MTEQALRYNEGKAELSYLMSAPYAMQGLCETFAFGAVKYDRDNWKRGFPSEKLTDSMLRHLLAYQNGETIDPESGIHHLNHMLWNAVALADQYNGKRDAANPKEEVPDDF